jgi:regulator of replication initiation timing
MSLLSRGDDQRAKELQGIEDRLQERMDHLFEQLRVLAQGVGHTSEEVVALNANVGAGVEAAQSSAMALKEDSNLFKAVRYFHEQLERLQSQLTELKDVTASRSAEIGRGFGESNSRIEQRLKVIEELLLEQSIAQQQEKKDLALSLCERLDLLDDNALQTPPLASDKTDALEQWIAEIEEGLEASEDLRGDAGLLVRRLQEHLVDLQQLEDDVRERNSQYWCAEDQLDRLENTLFRPNLGITWSDMDSHVCSPYERGQLRVLETAVINYRLLVQQELRTKTGIGRLAVTPHETRFDAVLHETSDFYTRSTDVKEKHNLITAVERIGFGRYFGSGVAPKVLRRATVRRYQYHSDVSLENNSPPALSSTVQGDIGTSLPASPSPAQSPPQETGLSHSNAMPEVTEIIESTGVLNANSFIHHDGLAPLSGEAAGLSVEDDSILQPADSIHSAVPQPASHEWHENTERGVTEQEDVADQNRESGVVFAPVSRSIGLDRDIQHIKKDPLAESDPLADSDPLVDADPLAEEDPLASDT